MIDIAGETLVLRRGGFSPPLSLLMPTFAFPDAPGILANPILRRQECSPTDVSDTSHGFGRKFYARVLSTQGYSTSELLRTL